MRRKVLALAVLCVWLLPTIALAQDDVESNVLETLAADDRFSTLVSLVELTDLPDALASDDSYTLLAPTNEAFAELPAFVVAYLTANPDLLAQTLRYHTLEGAISSAAIAADASTQATLSGASVTFFNDGDSILVDGVAVAEADIAATNGVIHVIDDVLVPPITLPSVDPLEITGDIDIAGSSTVLPLTDRMAEEFRAGGYTDDIEIESIGTGGGFESFCVSGETDISNASRAIQEDEILACEDRGLTPIPFRVGVDAMVVAVSTSNNFLQNLSAEELQQAFGNAEMWSDVNPDFPDEPISRFIPGTDSGTFDYFVQEVYEGDDATLLDATNTRLSEDDTVLVEGIEDNPYAIGFFGYAYFAENQEILNAVTLGGTAPTEDSAESGTYRLARPLFIYSAPSIMQEKSQVAAFINYYLTNVSDEVTDVGYFPASRRTLNLGRLYWLAATDDNTD